MSAMIDGAGGSVSGGRWRSGRGAAVAVAVGLVVSLMVADLGHVVAGTAPPDSAPPTTSENAPPTTVENAPPTTVVAVAPELAVTDTTLAVAADTPEPTTTAPTTTAPTSATTSTAPTTSAPVPSTADVGATASSPSSSVVAVEETYSLTVVAVCDGGMTPAVDVTNTGTGTIRVSVGPVAMDLTAADPSWHAPWPEIERGLVDPHPKWDAVRLDTMAIFDSGTLDLPADCPPPPIVPGVPQAISSTPGDASVSLSWLPPASDGGAAITGYAIEYQALGAVDWLHFGDVDAATTGVVVTGLVNGTTYMFRVIAVNANGPGEPGEAKDTPRTVPARRSRCSGQGPTSAAGSI